MDATPTQTPPARRDVKAALLWCARWLTPGGGFYRGPVRVCIEFGGAERDEVTVRPKGDVTGLDAPPLVRPGPTAGPSQSELVRHFLSDKERTILKVLAEAPSRAGEVEEAVAGQVKRTDFWTLWANLQVRGLIAEEDRGFELAGWVRPMLEVR